MPNYKQGDVTGSKWQRSKKVIVDNPYQGTPIISFVEEEIIEDAQGNTFTKSIGGINEAFNPASTFDLIHPVTEQVIGSVSHMDIYIILNSLYRHLADRRDLANPQDPQ